MTVESDLYTALKTLVSNRVYPDVAPAGVVLPYITYQQVGGDVINMLGPYAPGKRNGRFQINVWATTRAAANALMKQVEDAVITSTTLNARSQMAAISTYEEETKLYGQFQIFSIWFVS